LQTFAGSYVDGSQIKCPTPSVAQAASVALSISFGGAFMSTGLTFNFKGAQVFELYLDMSGLDMSHFVNQLYLNFVYISFFR